MCPDLAASAITGMTNNPILLALLLNLILLVLGCIMDMAPIILIATPILLPIATSIGLDPIQFGIMVVLNCGIGLLTPPVGAVLFIGSAVAKVPMERVVKATLPFYVCMIITLLLITFYSGCQHVASICTGPLINEYRKAVYHVIMKVQSGGHVATLLRFRTSVQGAYE